MKTNIVEILTPVIAKIANVYSFASMAQFRAAYVTEQGQCPDKKADSKGHKEWTSLYWDAVRLARKNGTLELSPAERGESTRTAGSPRIASSLRPDVMYAGKEFTFGEAKRFVERCNGIFDVEVLIAAIRAHGYTAECSGTLVMFEAPKPVGKEVLVVDPVKAKAEIARLQAKAAKDQEKLARLTAGLAVLSVTEESKVETTPVEEPKVETPEAAVKETKVKKARKAA